MHFVGHHSVLNDQSASTPVRVVTDSALKNCYTGPSLNELLLKGPNSLNNMFQVLIRWRSYPVSLTWDLSKAYHSLKSSKKDMFLRLVVWRFGRTNEEFSVFGHGVVGFGDKSAATLLELAKEKIAELGKKIDLEASEKLVGDSYVDDHLSGGSSDSVDRMMGERITGEDGEITYTGTVPRILAEGGFKAKSYIKSGESNPEILSSIGKTLGLDFRPREDEIEFELVFNLSPRQGGVKLGPNLSMENIDQMKNCILTRRICLQLTHQIYDPMGLICAFTIRFKIALKKLVVYQLGWDEPIPPALQKEWKDLIIACVKNPPISIPRSFFKDNCTGRPEFIGYWDGSDQAYDGIVYSRWKVEDSAWHTCLIAGKARVTPSSGITTPRAELCGLVTLSRLMDSIIASVPIKPRRITLIGDSTCTIASCEANCASLGAYFANRVVEIVDLMDKWGVKTSVSALEELQEEEISSEEMTTIDQLWHTPGDKNPADLPTRGMALWTELDRGSTWQKGPDYLRLPRQTWPLSRNFIPSDHIPKEESRSKFFKILNSIQIPRSKFNSWRNVMSFSNNLQTVRGIIARLIKMEIFRDKEKGRLDLSVADYEAADRMLAWLAVPDTIQLSLNADLSGLSPFLWKGQLYTRGRIGQKGMARHTGFDKLLLLPSYSMYASLIMWAAHNEDHKAAGDTLFRSRRFGVWIHRGRKLAERICKECPFCKLQSTATLEQQIADLPDYSQQTEVPPFTHISCDFMGPIKFRCPVNVRKEKKGFPIIFVCQSTKAVHIQLATGYGTDDFLTQFYDFTSVRGWPRTIYTDMGSQLRKAGDIMKSKQTVTDNLEDSVQWGKVVSATARKGSTWRHAVPGGQHRNGTSEAIVKQIKRTAKHLMKEKCSKPYEETVTLLRRMADVVNNRPLGIHQHGKAEGELVPITPNSLLKTSRTLPSSEMLGNYDDTPDRYCKKQRFADRCLLDWWNSWYTQVWDSLVPMRRWKTIHRNVAEGDVVLVKYTSKVEVGDYRKGLITKVYPDSKDLVRTARVRMMRKDSRTISDINRVPKAQEIVLPVQRLIVLLPIEERNKIGGLDNDD